MTRFSYQAYDASGRLLTGHIESPSRDSAFAELKRAGNVPVDISVADEPASGAERRAHSFAILRGQWSGRRGALSASDRLLVVRELASLTSANLAVDECLRITSANPRLGAAARRALADVLARIEAGEGLAGAMAAHHHDFPLEITRPIATAEASGTLAPVLGRLAELLERRDAGSRRLRSALTYPAFLLVAALATMFVVTGALVPAIAPLFEDSGVEMPIVLATLRELQGGVLRYGWILLAAAVLVTAALASRSGAALARRAVDRIVLGLPLVGRLVRDAETQRFAATLSMLLDGGVQQLEALRITSDALSTSVYRRAVAQLSEAIAEGGSLADEMTKQGLFGDVAVRLVVVGERTGQLSAMLARLAHLLEDAQRTEVERLLGLIGPVLTVVVGLFVGGIVVSIMSAIGALNELAFK